MPAVLKEFFFDQEKIIRSMDAATYRNMVRVGSFLRRRIRSSMRQSKGISAPGSPPKVHSGELRNGAAGVQFAYDPNRKSVFVGATPLPSVKGPKDGPHLLEFGGTAPANGRVILAEAILGKFRGKNIIGKTRVPLTGMLNYRPRPYAGPALKAELAAGTIPSAWENSLRSS